jgi:hypothetical protein
MNPNKQEKKFEKELNTFMLLLKQANKVHAEYIVSLGNQYVEIGRNYKEFKQFRVADTSKSERKKAQWTEFIDECEVFEQRLKQARQYFSQQIKMSNAVLGGFSNHWGGFVEQVAVIYFLDVLQKELGVRTWCQKFRKSWDKRGGVEIDILALSDEICYIIEVKNQLKIENIDQVNKVLTKVEEHLPELSGYKKQSIVMCLNIDDRITDEFEKENIWVIKYDGYKDGEMKNEWVWVCPEAHPPTHSQREGEELYELDNKIANEDFPAERGDVSLIKRLFGRV